MSGADKYAVFGHPVRHSKSPWIHEHFARQCNQNLQYRAVQVAPDKFAATARQFFAGGGRGLNITLPFKQEACALAGQLSERAHRAVAANTLWRDADGKICGDNTDGIGLVRDMLANLGWTLRATRILVLGAGGAVRGVLELLLREQPQYLLLVNRSAAKAEQLAVEFADLGPIAGAGYEALTNQQFDLIINGTSASLQGELPALPAALLTGHSCCYDMMYAAEPTVFMRWATQNAASAVADGLGMLVEQAAESFYLWRGLRPRTDTVLAALRHSMTGV